MNSKYTVTERFRGFKVEGKDRTSVDVGLLPTHWVVDYGKGEPVTCGLYEYYKLSASIAEGLMTRWVSPKKVDGGIGWQGAKEWATKQTAGAIGKRVHAQWRRLLDEAPPTIKAVQKAAFAAGVGCPGVMLEPDLYARHYLVKDITQYRAAALATGVVFSLTEYHIEQRFRNSPKMQQLRSLLCEASNLAESIGLSPTAVKTHVDGYELRAAVKREEKPNPLDELEHWPRLFSPNYEAYRSLRRTLTNLPAGVPAWLLSHLIDGFLPRPIFERSELAPLLWAWRIGRTRAFTEEDFPPANIAIFEQATKAQIKEAMRRVAGYAHRPLSFRKVYDIGLMARFLLDYPDKHNGNLVGLADKCIRWHLDNRAEDIQKQVDKYGEGTQTAEPPIPLPDMPGVKFLATVKDVCQEGETMGHCVAAYTERAVRGWCYLFHADYQNEQATVEVNTDGSIAQAHGPSNTDNVAVRWAKRALARWGRTIPEGAQPIYHYEGIAHDDDDNIPF